MASPIATYELFAIRYATRHGQRRDHFIGGDPHDAPMPMDYFVWVAAGRERTFVIDTGFTAEVAARRGRTHLRCPIESLALLGIAPAAVQDVVLTHLHYDHVGNFHKFPAARFHLQDGEMAYATGRHMRHDRLSHAFEVDDVSGVVRLVHGERIVFHQGDAELASGISVHLAGGHSAGLQCVRVHTQRGWVVVASDVSHFYENMEARRPFPVAFHVGDMLEGFERLYALADSPRHVVPGHDPLVMQRYPAPQHDLRDIVARLDVEPVSNSAAAPVAAGTVTHS